MKRERCNVCGYPFRRESEEESDGLVEQSIIIPWNCDGCTGEHQLSGALLQFIYNTTNDLRRIKEKLGIEE